MNKLTHRFIGYIRVSTKTQTKGTSLEYQKEMITKYCQANDIELVKLFTDKGLSAYKKRPQFDLMINKLLNDDNIHGVIVNDLTRFGRSTMDLLFQINQLQSKGKNFITIKDNFNTDTKTGKLLLIMLSAIADFERETIRERMVAGKEWAKIHGTRSGKPMHRPLIDIDWDRVKELRGYGLSWRKTAKEIGISAPTIISRAKEKGLF